MNPAEFLQAVDIAPFVYGLSFVVLGFMFTMLYEAFSFTAEAGLHRLGEKFPSKEKYLPVWQKRWTLYRIATMLAAILSHLIAITFLVLALHDTYPEQGAILLICVMALAILLSFSIYIIPRALAESHADQISATYGPFAQLITIPLLPLAWPLAKIEHILQTQLIRHAEDEFRPSSEDEIKSIVDQNLDDELEEQERAMIKSVFEFDDTLTREIMTPRVDIDCLEESETIYSCLDRIKSSHHSRFPVFQESLDHVLGTVHIKDLFRLLSDGDQDTSILRGLKETNFVPESMPISDLLKLMRRDQSQVAIVVDEYGGTAGLVTMEDILEELVGDIQDDFDQEEVPIRILSDQSAVVNARLPVAELNEELSLEIPERDEYDSLAGYVFYTLGHIPKVGETIENESLKITVQSANPRQLHLLRIEQKNTSST